MKRVETPEFSVEVSPMFETVRIFGGSIGLKREPETTFSPQISVFATDAEKGQSPEDWLTNVLKDSGPIVERKPVTFAGMTGEITKIKDRLKDYETGEENDWYRLRVLLVSSDGSSWYHGMAMASADDLLTIEADFTRLLNSISIKLGGDAAKKSRESDEANMDALIQQLRAKMEQESAGREERERAAKAAQVKAPVEDIETRFDKAIASAGLTGKRDVLRKIAVPTLSLTEISEAGAGQTGVSRVGGGPDLPEGIDWPRDDSGFYLNFLAQIDLAKLPAVYEDLPNDGLLSFFTGTDYTDWKVIHTQAGAKLVTRELPADAEDTTISAMRMVVWDSQKKRFVADGTSEDGLSVETDDKGRMTFKREGKPITVFASEYEISQSQQLLRFEPSLSVPYGLAGNNRPQAYIDAGLEDPSDFWQAVDKGFVVGDGPQHQMFGVTGIRNLASIQKLAADYAIKKGWADIAKAEDWFILIKLASGGEANFSFSDHGDYIFMVNRKDAATGDFSRVYAFVESG